MTLADARFFKNVFEDDPEYTLIAERHSIVFGDTNAGHIITMVADPYCPVCAKVFLILDELLHTGNDIKLQIVFMVPDDEDDLKTRLAKHLMALKSSINKTRLNTALCDWYLQKNKDYEAWLKAYPCFDAISPNASLVIQKQWLGMANVTGAPTLFINGRKLSQSYPPADIKHLI